MNNILKIILLLQLSFCYSQNNSIDEPTAIASVLENYFNLEREAVHLHFNKNTFLNNEEIWFKGYVISRKKLKPFFTTNIFIVLRDEKGNQISEQLVYANNGSFAGKIELNRTMRSGNYYIQAYTNWMNNFNEDESTLSRITLINPSEGVKDYTKVTPGTLQISINPEGGKYITETENTLGISLLDCRNNTIDDIEGKLQTLNGEILSTFRLNQFGYGKITVPPTREKLKITFHYKDEIFEKELPMPQEYGIALAANNFSNAEKLFINLKTNTTTLKNLNSKKLFLVISQDEKSIVQEFSFDHQTFLSFVIENKVLFKGINTLRIIDGELNQLCERLIYSDAVKANVDNPITIVKNKSEKTQINLVGYNGFSNSNLSISVLPAETRSNDLNKTSIAVGLSINPYLKDPLENSSYYFKERGLMKKFELDLVLLNQQELKYDWNYMKINAPEPNYSFDIGLRLEGSIDEKIKNKTEHKVQLLSYFDFINETFEVNEQGQYSIDNLVLPDSTHLDIALLKLPDFKKVATKLNPTIVNRNRPFFKPFKIKSEELCESSLYETIAYEYPKLSRDIIKLDDVVIKNKYTKPKLTFQNNYGNMFLKGFKVDEQLRNRDLLQFIRSKGFIVNRNGGEILITTNMLTVMDTTNKRGLPSPEITIDGIRLNNFDMLANMQMYEIDEIFLSTQGIITGISKNKHGIINIYTKKPADLERKPDNYKFFIGKAFSKPIAFEGLKYINTVQKGFDNYGVIGWNPSIITDDAGQFEFEVANFNNETVLIDIEGIDTNGAIIQQEMVLNLN